MKYELSQHAKDVISNREIDIKWIDDVLSQPTKKDIVNDREVHFFKSIVDASNKCLKVVVNPINEKIITAYFDRNMRKKGCKWKLNMTIKQILFM